MSETQANEGDEVVWWLKWATRGVGACGAVASGVCGILSKFLSSSTQWLIVGSHC